MVRDVKVDFIVSFQHAAIDVKIEMAIHKGPSEILCTPKKILDCDPLRRNNAEEYTHWAEETWQREFEIEHGQACKDLDTQKAFKICEAFIEKCLKTNLIAMNS